jgi:hypothetical protein
MKTNKDFRKSGDDSRGGGCVKGKAPLKEKKLKRSIYDEIEENEDFGYSSFRKKESVEDYFDYEEFDLIEHEYDDFDDDEY